MLRHAPATKALRRRLNTPTKVQRWLKSLAYNSEETMYGLDMVVRRGRAHCLEGALSAAALLEYHGLPPLILDLQSKDLLDHTLFLFQDRGRWGTVGKSRDVGLDGRRPFFKTIRALVQSYTAPYIDDHAELYGYAVLDLRTISGRWRTSQRSVWYVEEILRHLKHSPLRLPPSFVKHWRAKHRAWRRQHPTTPPNFYPQQDTWI